MTRALRLVVAAFIAIAPVAVDVCALTCAAGSSRPADAAVPAHACQDHGVTDGVRLAPVSRPCDGGEQPQSILSAPERNPLWLVALAVDPVGPAGLAQPPNIASGRQHVAFPTCVDTPLIRPLRI